MKMLNAHTFEADDADLAIQEISSRLEESGGLSANSAGFITCSYDFVESGVASAVCKAMPFDVVGCTTLSNGVNQASGSMLLCLSVLTGEDCSFSTALSGPLTTGPGRKLEHEVAHAWQQAVSGVQDDPVFILAFCPMLPGVSGEAVLNALDTASGGVPIFGTTACDHDTATHGHSFVLHNGQCVRDRLAFLVVRGNANPRFIVTATADAIHPGHAWRISDAEGSVLKSVDGKSARDFLKTIGLAEGQGMAGLICIPFLVDFKDGTQPVARAIYALTEEGYALCGGSMPNGAEIRVTSMSPSQIVATAERSLRLALDEGNNEKNGLILFPCLGRNMVLAAEPEAEIETIRALAANRISWHLAYSGGEICPLPRGGSLVNRFHNFTFVACVL